jgi:putative tryptophan/tyrosine transport system substrate-binding protein
MPQVDGMIVLTSPLIFNQRSQIADLALKARLPTINGFNLYPKVGGLMAYGPNFPSIFKRAASYVDRILSGAKPGELPIERPTKRTCNHCPAMSAFGGKADIR